MHQRHEQLAILAYQRWESRGCPDGSADEDWSAAEHELNSGMPIPPISQTGSEVDGALKDSFPASDPPASQLPDEPPSNADDKWAAAHVNRSVDLEDVTAAK